MEAPNANLETDYRQTDTAREIKEPPVEPVIERQQISNGLCGNCRHAGKCMYCRPGRATWHCELYEPMPLAVVAPKPKPRKQAERHEPAPFKGLCATC